MSPFVNTTKYWNIVSKCEFLGCFGLPPFEILAGEAISGLPPDISAHIGPRVDSKLDHKRVKWRRSKLYGSKVSGVQACINDFLWIKVFLMFLTVYYTVRVVWDDNGEQIGEGTNLHKKRSKSMERLVTKPRRVKHHQHILLRYLVFHWSESMGRRSSYMTITWAG